MGTGNDSAGPVFAKSPYRKFLKYFSKSKIYSGRVKLWPINTQKTLERKFSPIFATNNYRKFRRIKY